MRRRRRHTLSLCVGTVLLLGGCSVDGYAFRVDDSINITMPRARSMVELPTRVRWQDSGAPDDLRVDPSDPDASYYGVFVDRAPLRPGQEVTQMAGMFLTAEPQVTLDVLSATTRPSSKDPHEVTIVRMRGNRRVGEAAFRVTFFVRR